MTVKSLRKQLAAAIAMTLVATVALGSSTYAWFAMNTHATATDMQVVAKTDNTYLLINTGDNDTAGEVQSAGVNTIALTVSDDDAKVYPSSPALETAEVNYLTTSGKTVAGAAITTAGVQVTNASTAAAVTNWFTANALAVGAADIDTTSARQLTTFDSYVIRKTVYLTVAAGSNGCNNLTVTPTITQKTGGSDVTAVKVLVTTDDGGFAVLTSSTSEAVDISGNNTTITDQGVRTVNIYIYYDGDEAPVYTNNAANLTGADIDLAFDVDAIPAN